MLVSSLVVGDLVRFNSLTDLHSYVPKQSGDINPVFVAKVKKGEKGVVLSIDSKKNTAQVLFDDAKVIDVYSWMLEIISEQ